VLSEVFSLHDCVTQSRLRAHGYCWLFGLESLTPIALPASVPSVMAAAGSLAGPTTGCNLALHTCLHWLCCQYGCMMMIIQHCWQCQWGWLSCCASAVHDCCVVKPRSAASGIQGGSTNSSGTDIQWHEIIQVSVLSSCVCLNAIAAVRPTMTGARAISSAPQSSIAKGGRTCCW